MIYYYIYFVCALPVSRSKIGSFSTFTKWCWRFHIKLANGSACCNSSSPPKKALSCLTSICDAPHANPWTPTLPEQERTAHVCAWAQAVPWRFGNVKAHICIISVAIPVGIVCQPKHTHFMIAEESNGELTMVVSVNNLMNGTSTEDNTWLQLVSPHH